ncbi:CoA transferase [Bordetella genomosp. 10]|uniref:CoA transferase n=2 Tax=Bordetella genomosp. 10 TaxID=1416804 RepID=A0A261SN86_9BORD|nr:CoA transferase [Bordetella genomosp. 10]
MAPSDPDRLVLNGLRVLEIGSGPAVAYAGKLFADFGAEVIKVEPAQGDEWRKMPPLLNPRDPDSESALFAWLNTNKRSVRADPGRDARWLAELAIGCDVVLDGRALSADAAPGPLWTRDDAGRAGDPIRIDFTWFGADGPYSGFAGAESVVRALSGAVHGSGPVAGPPHMPHDLQVGIVGGLQAFSAAIAAWIGRAQGSRHYTLSLHEAVFGLVEMEAGMVQDGRHPLRRLGVNRFCNAHPAGIYETADGWIGLFTHTLPQWSALCAEIGRPELAAAPAYATGPDRINHADEIDAFLIPAMRRRTAREWFERLGARKYPAVLVPSMEELLRQQVHRERGAFAVVAAGGVRFEGPVVPFRLGAEGPLPGGEAPRFGAHGDLYRSLPHAPRAAARRQPAPAGSLPLAGVRILDLSMGWAGPLASRTLADLGADVIKVESITYPDWWRGTNFNEPFYRERLYEKVSNFNMMNRNKLGITLDLTQPRGRELLLSLLKLCDACIENYSAEVLPKLGLAYDTMRAVHPGIVVLSMPAFGLGNAWSDTRAYGGTLEQASGLPLYTGHAAHPPAMTSYAFGDPVGGMNAGAALLLGILAQRVTGKGRHINFSQVEAMLPMTAPFMIEQSVAGRVPTRQGNRHPLRAPHGCYRCAGEDAWVALSVDTGAAWIALCRLLGRFDWEQDARLRAASGRQARCEEVGAAIAAWTARLDADAAMAALQAAGIPAGVVRPMREVLDDAHLNARGFWKTAERPYAGRYKSTSPPLREAGAPLPVARPAPTLGQHTREVFAALLDLDDAAVDALEAAGVCGTQARPKARRPSAN